VLGKSRSSRWTATASPRPTWPSRGERLRNVEKVDILAGVTAAPTRPIAERVDKQKSSSGHHGHRRRGAEGPQLQYTSGPSPMSLFGVGSVQ